MSCDSHPAVHILCFEEAGDCTLERVAREARPGDAVAVFGPAAFVERLRGFGLKDGVVVAHSNRVAGSWWMAHGARALEDELRAALETAPGAEHRRSPDAPLGRIAYGPRAQWLSARDARGQFNARPPFPLPDPVEAEAATEVADPAAVAREITKVYEETRRGTLSELVEKMGPEGVRGEVTVILAGNPEEETADPRAIREALRACLDSGVSRKEAVERVAKELGAAKREVYGECLKMKETSERGG